MQALWFIAGFVIGAGLILVLLLPRRRHAADLARTVVEEANARRIDELNAVIERLKDAFGALSRDALSRNSDDFFKLAADRFQQQAVQSEQTVESKKKLIDAQLEVMSTRLTELSTVVQSVEKERRESHGTLTARLDESRNATLLLHQTASQLREALASSQRRGEWGQRIAEEVLRLAGFIENVSYTKQTTLEGGNRPDFTFMLPDDRVVHMDVKFPLDNYRKYYDAADDVARKGACSAFLADMRKHIRDVTGRDYIDPANGTVDYVLVFIANEQIYGFMHEHDASLIDDALAKRVVLCSPLTLYAVLAVVRQAAESHRMTQASGEILSLLGAFKKQWDEFIKCSDKLGRHLQAALDEYQALTTTRARMLDRRLDKIEDLRVARGLPAEPAAAEAQEESRPGAKTPSELV